MVYLRAKVVKGERYLYLVKSVWDAKRSTSKQETVKYLGKASDITKDDIPQDYRDDPKIISFLASDGAMDPKKREEVLSELREQLLRCLMHGDVEDAKKVYEDYSTHSGTANFFEKILTPVMYKVGDLWAKNKIGIADEHVCSNVANTLVKIIFERNMVRPTKKKVLVCTPEGEHHNLGANILESHLSCHGFKVHNLSPSEPHESIVRYVESAKPDVVFVSITLADNIKPGQRLVKRIKERTNVPIFVGGQAVREYNARFDAIVVRDSSLKDLPKLIA